MYIFTSDSNIQSSINAVNFDGINDYLLRGGGLTGANDGKQATFSGFIKRHSSNNRDTLIGSTDSFYIRVNPSPGGFPGQINVRFINSANNNFVLDALSNIELLQGVWYHVLFSCDLSDPAKRHLYINDTDSSTWSIYINDNFNLTHPDLAVGARTPSTAPSDIVNADFAEFWFDQTYIDFSIEANRRKFANSDGKPVNLGSFGQLPTGSQPLIFLSGAVDQWHINKGIGGGFTENGELTAASTSPSD